MKDYQQQFIQLALDCQALRFGEFTLKSGRISPYFFNAGLFNSGATLAKLGQFFAKAIEDAKLDYDILFGPAYKGIPLASATSIALAEQFGKDISYCFNRKEAKDHGEGGNLVGAPLQGKTLIIDDVITAGTAKREAIAIIEAAQAEFAGIVIALDRKERGQGEHSAIQELQQQYDVPVVSIISLENIIEYLEQQGSKDTAALDKILTYRNEYGV